MMAKCDVCQGEDARLMLICNDCAKKIKTKKKRA